MKYYRLNELTDATGVTSRTIRFYIAEGLLPPPQGAGPASVYTSAHRDRLRLIGLLKDQYLPLREIRRRLATLTDAQVRAELQAQPQLQELPEEVAMSPAPPSPPLSAPPSPPGNSAADYLDSVLNRDARPAAPRPSAPPAYFPPAPQPSTPAPTPTPTREQWERIALADGIELHVRDDRRQERILLEALIRQARKLLGEP
ncbi:MAG: MerR family transcriptional regulator [Thermomicrobiales bacterium]